MFKDRYTLSDSFEVSGRWWLPESPEKTTAGTLRYEPDELQLVLNGSLDDPHVSDLGVVPENFARFPCVHGVSDSGQRCTLLNVFVTERTRNLRATIRVKYSAIYLLVGCHAASAEHLRFESVTVRYTHLDDFLNPNVFSIARHEHQGQFQGMTVTCTVPPKVSFRVAAIAANLDIEVHLINNQSRTKVAVSAEPCITISPDSPQSLDSYITNIWRLCYLLSLLTDEPIHPIWLRFVTEGGTSNGWLLNKTSRPVASSGEPSSLLLFYAAHLHDHFQSVCDKWFSASDVLSSAIQLFMDARRSRGEILQGRFLMLSQAMEALSRATTSSEYMLTADYEQVKTTVVAAIPGNVGSDHRASLKNRIKYGNAFSLRKRLDMLVESLTPEAIDCVCKRPRNFVAGVVETRNYLTHYTDELRPKALEGVELSWACERMIMLLRVLFLKEVGIDEQLIVQRIEEHSRLSQYIRLYKTYPECVS